MCDIKLQVTDIIHEIEIEKEEIKEEAWHEQVALNKRKAHYKLMCEKRPCKVCGLVLARANMSNHHKTQKCKIIGQNQERAIAKENLCKLNEVLKLAEKFYDKEKLEQIKTKYIEI